MNVHSIRRPSVAAPDLDDNGFAAALHSALAQRPRRISPKWLYDARGSELFEAICEQPEYYPTRTEMALLEREAGQIAALIGPQAELIEFGAGAARKVRLLLDALRAPRRFVAIDISGEHLEQSLQPLRADFPQLDVRGHAADFTAVLPRLEADPAVATRVGFFPGSSIGNFEPEEAAALLRRFAGLLRADAPARCGLLIGVDLIKPPARLHAAYNDAAGITAQFNLNLLARANRELGTDFDLEAFDHYAHYAPQQRRIEMHLVSRSNQTVHLQGHAYSFDAGASLHTENSYKYSVPQFQALARRAGFEPQQVWTDPERLFSLHWLALPGA
jgi:dimethylhistidine N-methyltransferase